MSTLSIYLDEYKKDIKSKELYMNLKIKYKKNIFLISIPYLNDLEYIKYKLYMKSSYNNIKDCIDYIQTIFYDYINEINNDTNQNYSICPICNNVILYEITNDNSINSDIKIVSYDYNLECDYYITSKYDNLYYLLYILLSKYKDIPKDIYNELEKLIHYFLQTYIYLNGSNFNELMIFINSLITNDLKSDTIDINNTYLLNKIIQAYNDMTLSDFFNMFGLTKYSEYQNVKDIKFIELSKHYLNLKIYNYISEFFYQNINNNDIQKIRFIINSNQSFIRKYLYTYNYIF